MAAPQKWWIVVRAHSDKEQVIEDVLKPAGYETVLGPWDTRAQAEAALAKPITPAKPPISIPNPLSGIGAVGHWIGDIALHLTDGAMWRSLGWLALGAILVIAGIYLWFRTSVTYKDVQSAILGTVKAL